MAKQPLGFGDKNTADVRLNLIDSAGVEYPGNPLLLHSQVLKKAKFFETKLSQSGSSTKGPFEIKVTCSYDPASYIKCIQLIYSYDTDESFNFTHVDEALNILPVASEVMFRDCMESCMRYLAAVRWSREQQAKLRVLLSSSNINVLPDLAARLGMSQSKSDCEDLKMVKASLQELLQMTYHSKELRSIVEQHIFDYLKLNTSPAIKNSCRLAILRRFIADVKAIKSKSDDRAKGEATELACSDLSWLLGVIRRCDSKLLAIVVKEFCEDADLRNAVAGGAVQSYSAALNMLNILIDQILKAMENGEIITAVSFRVDFLTNWADTTVKLVNDTTVKPVKGYTYDQNFPSALESGIIGVCETLPLVEQKRIYSFWKDIFTKNSWSGNSLFKWWAQKLHDAIILDKIGQKET